MTISDLPQVAVGRRGPVPGAEFPAVPAVHAGGQRTDHVVRWLSVLVVVLIPVGWPRLPANVAPADVLVPVLLAALFAAGWRYHVHRLDVAAAGFVLTSLASLPHSLSPAASLLAVIKELYLVSLYVAIAASANWTAPEQLCRWLAISAAASAAASIIAAVAYVVTGVAALGEPMTLPYVGHVFRAQALFETPQFFGSLLTSTAPLGLLFLIESGGSRRWLLALGTMMVAELATFSKSIGGFAVALAMAAWPLLAGRTATRRAVAAGAVTLAVASNLMALVAIRGVDVTFGRNTAVPPPEYIYARPQPGADSLEVRVSYNPLMYYFSKKVAWTAFRRRPWTGIGAGTFPLEAERAFTEGRLHAPFQRIMPHSTPFGRLAETGLIGLAGLILLMSVLLWTGFAALRQATGDALAWALLAAALGTFVNSINLDVMHFRFLWFTAAVVRALDVRGRAQTLIPARGSKS